MLAAIACCIRAEPLKVHTSDGVDLYVQVRGSGPACLYIHGGPGSGSWWLEKFSGPMLEQRFRMIYLDQRGVARSTSPQDGNYSMDRMVRDFEEVRAALHIEKWFTLGHSFGGLLQVGYAQRHPQAISGMIMLNCSLNLTRSLAESLPKACELLGDNSYCTDTGKPVLERLMAAAGKLREKDLFWKMMYASQENERRMGATFDEIPNWNHDQENKLSLGDYQADFSPASIGLKMPVLFFYGKTDWAAGPSEYKYAHFPDQLLWGSNAGHVPFLENPADLEKAIDQFRSRTGL
ncbi:MAG: alpha/beta hydrolase [Bryobacteraceae bacterium]